MLRPPVCRRPPPCARARWATSAPAPRRSPRSRVRATRCPPSPRVTSSRSPCPRTSPRRPAASPTSPRCPRPRPTRPPPTTPPPTPTRSPTDPTPANNSATDTDTVSERADLAISKTDGVTSVNAGGSTTYTIRVTNNGPSSVTGATLTDAATTGLSKTAVVCSGAVGNKCTSAPSIASLEGAGYSMPALASGDFYEITVGANVTATSGSVTNAASVAAPSGTTDPDGTNNSRSDTDTVSPVATLAVTKTDGTATIDAGSRTTYTITVTNNGPSDAQSVSLSDTLGAGL